MREWYLSSELVGLRGLANSTTGITQKAKRNNWLSRRSKEGTRALEYHISNFHPDVKKQLIEKYVTDESEAAILLGLTEPSRELISREQLLEVLRHDERKFKTVAGAIFREDGDDVFIPSRDDFFRNTELVRKLYVRLKYLSPENYEKLLEELQLIKRDTDGGIGSLLSNVTEMPNVKSVKEVSQMNDMCAVPVYNVYASCGFGALGDTEYQIRTEFLPCEWLKRFGLTEEIARIIECHGDSMEDTLSDGDEVLVDTRELEHPVKHGVYVVRIGKHVYIKRLKYDIMAEGYEVISDNRELYEPFIVNGDKLQEFAVIGKVVTTVMKAVV